MSIKNSALAALVAYLAAHEEWNRAQTDRAAKVKRDTHKALIEIARTYKPQHKPDR